MECMIFQCLNLFSVNMNSWVWFKVLNLLWTCHCFYMLGEMMVKQSKDNSNSVRGHCLLALQSFTILSCWHTPLCLTAEGNSDRTTTWTQIYLTWLRGWVFLTLNRFSRVKKSIGKQTFCKLNFIVLSYPMVARPTAFPRVNSGCRCPVDFQIP